MDLLLDICLYLTAVLICYKIRVYYTSLLWHNNTDNKDVKQTNETNDIDVVIFVPNDNVAKNAEESPLNQLMAALDKTQNCLDICVYSLSLRKIVDKCIELHKRGIAIRVITNWYDNHRKDNTSYAYLMIEDRPQQKASMKRLKDNNIDVKYLRLGLGYMHNKFAIIDNKILINGSFNWTQMSIKQNYEDLVITSDKKLVAAYAKQFLEYWNQFEEKYERALDESAESIIRRSLKINQPND